MPLVYQGRLLKRRPRGPAAALKAVEGILSRTTHDRRLDVRLAWDGPDPFERCAAELPDDFAGYWIDIAVEPDPSRLEEAVAWARALRGGRLAVACVLPGRENEVGLRLAGDAPLRLDAERLDPHRGPLYRPQMTVRYAEGGERTAPSSDRRALAAARVRAAAEMIGLDAAARQAVFVDDARIPPAASAWMAVEPARPGPGLGADDSPIGTPGGLKGAVVDGTPYGLQCELEDLGPRVAVWRRWAGLLDRVDVLLLRCMGTRAAIAEVLDRFDLHHRHVARPHQTFGLYTAHHPEALPVERLAAIIRAPQVRHDLIEWGLRWSGLRLALDGPLDQAEGPARSFLVVRTERRRIYDSLHLTLETEDPGARALRNARRQLAADFGALVEQPSAWQYVGPGLDTARGRRYEALRGALRALVDRDPPGAPVSGGTPGAPGWLGRVGERLRAMATDDGGAFDLVPAFERALSEALPGFRHDKRAHLTDRYFVAFARRAPHGVHLILLRRLHAPAGFRVSVGVSTVPLQLADLDPGTGRSAPGLAVPLATLVPERGDLDWRYTGRPSGERAVADAMAVLAARAGPFFADADRALAAWTAADEEDP